MERSVHQKNGGWYQIKFAAFRTGHSFFLLLNFCADCAKLAETMNNARFYYIMEESKTTQGKLKDLL